MDTVKTEAGTAEVVDASCATGQRPLRADAAKNRVRVLEAAEEVFSAEGVGAPIDLVAERAGVGVGTVYRHFPTKEALFEAIVITRLQQLVDAASAAAESDDPGQAFFAYVQDFARQASTKHDLADALGAAGIDIKTQCGEQFDAMQAGMRTLLDRAKAVGAVRADLTVSDVIGLTIGACHAAKESGLGVACDRLVGLVCDGLRPRGK